MSEVRELVDCFFRFKRLYDESGDVLYLVFMENVARQVGGEFYAWWRRVFLIMRGGGGRVTWR